MMISNWLIPNELVVDMGKTVEMTMSNVSSAMHYPYSICDSIVKIFVCKYLGIKIQCELPFQSHIDSVLETR